MHSYLYYPLTTEINELKIAKIGKFDPDCKSEINKWDIDMGFKRTLQWYWFKSEVCVGPTLYSVKQIVAREKEMGNLRKSVDGLLWQIDHHFCRPRPPPRLCLSFCVGRHQAIEYEAYH